MRVVNSLDELLRLPRDPRVNGFGARPPLRLEIPELTRHGLLRAQGSLNRLQSRCGCLAGGLFVLAALGYGGYAVFERNSSLLSFAAARDLVVVLLTAFFGGLVAKLATLAVTRWQFARRCRAWHRHLVDELLTLRSPHVDLHTMGR